MAFVAIEYGQGDNRTLGYLRIPSNFNPKWHLGFRKYLSQKYKATEIKIYPIPVHQNTDTITIAPVGYKDMEDDFNLALQSFEYYPPTQVNSDIRRSWMKSTPRSAYFKEKYL